MEFHSTCFHMVSKPPPRGKRIFPSPRIKFSRPAFLCHGNYCPTRFPISREPSPIAWISWPLLSVRPHCQIHPDFFWPSPFLNWEPFQVKSFLLLLFKLLLPPFFLPLLGRSSVPLLLHTPHLCQVIPYAPLSLISPTVQGPTGPSTPAPPPSKDQPPAEQGIRYSEAEPL